MTEPVPPRPPLAAVALLSAATLAYELLLLRLFAIIQWHHFAYLAISVALLGFGAAGTFVTLARARLLARYPGSFTLSALGFAIAAPGGFMAAQRVPFNALELTWNPAQFLSLGAIYLLLSIPFFCAATALCLAYARFGADIPRLYAADILGAGLGSVTLLALLFVLHPASALRAIGALGLAAAALAAWPGAPRRAALLGVLAGIGPWLLPAPSLQLMPSDYKDLSQALRVKDARIVAERSGPLGLVTAVASPRAPPHHAPGLSLNAADGPPPQLALFIDGQAAGAVNRAVQRFDGDAAQSVSPLAYLADSTSALPYRLLDRPRVLVLGAGAGTEVLQALQLGARQITTVEFDRQLVGLIEEDLAEFSGRPFSQPGVRLVVAEPRGFVAASREQFELIVLALPDAPGSGGAGLGSLSESPLHTVAAFESYLARLAPGGLLAITRGLALPPRDSLRLFATAIAALEARGVAEPGRNLALIRNWNTSTLLISNGAFTAAQLAAVRDFCRRHSFDIAHVPGITAAESNVFNLLPQDELYAGTQALLSGNRANFVERYKFRLEPATDERPYFFHFFKWRTLPELLQLRRHGGLPPLDWGYPVLLMALIQATLASLLLILLPLALAGTRQAIMAAPDGLRWRVPAYFLALGLGFMAIEIPLLQRFTLFLSHPVYAASAVLSGFLICAGLGAQFSATLAPDARWPFAAIAAAALAHAFLLPPLLAASMGLDQAWKILLTLALVAPLAFCLGMPLALGLTALAKRAPPLVPWAWGINGFASVVATLLATLLAIHCGYAMVLMLAALLYVFAGWQLPRAVRP